VSFDFLNGGSARLPFCCHDPFERKEADKMDGSRGGRMALGMAVGVGLGYLFGAALLDNPTVGAVAGIALGAAVGYFSPSRSS
jgi:hypothetical protein